MHCFYCNNDDTRVIDSRVVEGGAAVRRRRECEVCTKRFSTYERAEIHLPLIVKKDSTRQAFDIEKIRSGMMKALEKRPVAAEAVELAINNILRAAQEVGEPEIRVERVGNFVMEQLQKLDGVAYVRFASVYREFKDVDEFLSAVKTAMGTKE
ncbi:MAG: transcriptional regulator NrdR [Mariprofundaceae bacterium]